MKKVAVILSGCGVYDGSEIHEAVLTILALDRKGADVMFFAPDDDQHHVINHLTGEPSNEKRNMLVEAARIARGEIHPLSEFDAGKVDAVVIPGGFGAAKNLCDYAFKGADCSVRPDVEKLLKDMRAAGKPIGAVCIAPAILAKVLGAEKVKLTIGSDEKTASDLVRMGAQHVERTAEKCLVDAEKKIVTAAAYMCAGSIKEAALGIEDMVENLLALVE